MDRRQLFLPVVQDAVAAGRVLVLDYEDADGCRSRRSVEPAGLVQVAGHRYLLGWCRLRQQARCFRLDRIVRALDTGTPAPQPRLTDAEIRSSPGAQPVASHG